MHHIMPIESEVKETCAEWKQPVSTAAANVNQYQQWTMHFWFWSICKYCISTLISHLRKLKFEFPPSVVVMLQSMHLAWMHSMGLWLLTVAIPFTRHLISILFVWGFSFVPFEWSHLWDCIISGSQAPFNYHIALEFNWVTIQQRTESIEHVIRFPLENNKFKIFTRFGRALIQQSITSIAMVMSTEKSISDTNLFSQMNSSASWPCACGENILHVSVSICCTAF